MSAYNSIKSTYLRYVEIFVPKGAVTSLDTQMKCTYLKLIFPSQMNIIDIATDMS